MPVSFLEIERCEPPRRERVIMPERICGIEGPREIENIGERLACKERTNDFKVHERKKKCVMIQRE